MGSRIHALCTGIGLCSLTASAFAADIVVTAGNSIQAAINVAVAGDRVLVAPGTYREAIDFKGKAIEVLGVGGPAVTVVDATGLGTSVVRFATNETLASELDGFTLRGGSAVDGGGIFIGPAGPTVRRCVIENNAASNRGGGVGIAQIVFQGFVETWLLFEDCVIRNNTSASGGGGAWVNGSHVTMRRCAIEQNVTQGDGGGIWASGGSNLFEDLAIRGNQAVGIGGGLASTERNNRMFRSGIVANSASVGGGVVYRYHSPLSILPSMLSCTTTVIAGNQASIHAGGVYSETTAASNSIVGAHTELLRCTVYGNTAPSIPALEQVSGSPNATMEVRSSIVWGHASAAVSGTINFAFSDVQGGSPGTGNLSADPKFVDPVAGDLHLKFGSPCIDVGTGVSTNLDFENDPIVTPNDMGADEFHRHMYVTGTRAAGANVQFKVIGQPGDVVVVFAGPGLLATPLQVPGFGAFLVEVPFAFGFPAALPTVGADGVLAIPIAIAPTTQSITAALQCAIGSELSNAELFSY